jgi:hypothetical protein
MRLFVRYAMSSKTIHRAISQPNYISWGSLLFGMDELEKMISALKPDDPKLKELITELADEEKIRFFPLFNLQIRGYVIGHFSLPVWAIRSRQI